MKDAEPEKQIGYSAELFDWIEQQGLENLRYHLASTDDLKKDANTTFNVLLTLAGAVFAFAVKSLAKGPLNALGVTAMVSGIYLALLCALVVWKCLRIGEAPAPTNSPKNLLTYVEHSLADAKAVELENLDERIAAAYARNNTTAFWINFVRFSALGVFPLAGVAHFLAF